MFEAFMTQPNADVYRQIAEAAKRAKAEATAGTRKPFDKVRPQEVRAAKPVATQNAAYGD